MKPYYSFLLFVTAMSLASEMFSQNHVEVTKTQNFNQGRKPELVDNYMYSTYYTNEKSAYNLKNFELYSGAHVIDFKVNPAGFSYAVASGNAKKSSVSIYDIVTENKILYKFKEITEVSAICYSADSRKLYIAVPNQCISVYETKGYTMLNQIAIPSVITSMVASSNGYFIAATTSDQMVSIINLQNNSVRLSLSVNENPLCVRFSEDATRIGILTKNKLTIYNTIDFLEETNFSGFVNAVSFDFHPEGKYVTIASDDKKISFFNMIDKSDKADIIEPAGSLGKLRYLKDAKRNSYLSYTTTTSIIYKMIKGLAPHYTHMLKEELNARMMEWCKRLPGESDEEFNQRVNEETMVKQKQLFANEISTELAGDMMAGAQLKLGSYNPENEMLTLHIDNLGSVFLKVPQIDLTSFDNPANLEFSDVQYGLTKEDRFEMIYAKVRNKTTGKEYVFDNLNRQSLDFLTSDESFVPLDLMHQAGKEDLALQGMATDIVNDARQKNLVSEHTNINVNAVVVSDYDANGKRINNYKVDFNYKVDVDYSAQEDYAIGKFMIEDSHAAISMLTIVVKAFTEDFAKYIIPGKKLIVSVTGSADATPIRGTIPYDGVYGDFQNEPFYLGGNLSNLSINKTTGIKSNEQLAFIRAQGVTSYLKRNLTNIANMDVKYNYNVEVAEETGSQFRRIGITFTFVDAF